MMYGAFAGVYDALMAGVDYAAWARYYLDLAGRSGVDCRSAADCACGTGGLTLALAALGVEVTGVDLSPDMLAVAGDKARGRGAAVPFVRQDMRRLLLHRPVDAVFSACDGVNYLASPADARAFFLAAYRAVRPGGGLFFDISTRRKLARTLGNRCLGNDDEKVSYLWQNHYDQGKRLLQMDLTFFVRQEDGRYARFAETHVQRAHETGELVSWLGQAGFTDIRCYGGQGFDPPAETEERVHFAAVRPLGDG